MLGGHDCMESASLEIRPMSRGLVNNGKDNDPPELLAAGPSCGIRGAAAWKCPKTAGQGFGTSIVKGGFLDSLRVAKRTLLLFFLVLVAAGAVVIGSPWWYPYTSWRRSTTSFVTSGPGIPSLFGVDPETYAVVNVTAFGDAPVPKLLHQTWRDADVPEKWVAARDSCQMQHPDFAYKLWTDAMARDLVKELSHEFPKLLATYDSYRHAIQRADVVRYALLYKYGGIYIDLDIVCQAPLHFLRRYPFVMPATRPVGFSQDFLVAAPGDPFVRQLLEALPRWNMNLLTKYPTVMFSTGPMFVTLQATFYRQRRSLWVLPDEMYGKYARSPRQLFRHLYGSSWHGEDARSILWILRHPLLLMSAIGAGFGAASYRLWLVRVSMRNKASEGADAGLLKIC